VRWAVSSRWLHTGSPPGTCLEAISPLLNAGCACAALSFRSGVHVRRGRPTCCRAVALARMLVGAQKRVRGCSPPIPTRESGPRQLRARDFAAGRPCSATIPARLQYGARPFAIRWCDRSPYRIGAGGRASRAGRETVLERLRARSSRLFVRRTDLAHRTRVAAQAGPVPTDSVSSGSWSRPRANIHSPKSGRCSRDRIRRSADLPTRRRRNLGRGNPGTRNERPEVDRLRRVSCCWGPTPAGGRSGRRPSPPRWSEGAELVEDVRLRRMKT